MAWFLGLFGFLFMLAVIPAPDWVIFNGAGPLENHDSSLPLAHVASGNAVTKVSWGLFAGSALAGDEWYASPLVSSDSGDGVSSEFLYDDRLPAWLSTLGLCLVIGELILLVGLLVVFLGLCACCISCCDGGAPARGKLFRIGMYLFLAADLLFFFSLLYFPVGMGLFGSVGQNISVEMTSVYGWGWGVVILVFVGALLLLLDKEVPTPPKDIVEAEKLL